MAVQYDFYKKKTKDKPVIMRVLSPTGRQTRSLWQSGFIAVVR